MYTRTYVISSMYVCVYVCMYVCLYALTYVRIHICIYVCLYVFSMKVSFFGRLLFLAINLAGEFILPVVSVCSKAIRFEN